MATVCAHINLRVLATPTSKSCSSCNNVVSQAAGVVNFRLQQGASVRSGYLQGLACRASSGGSRRDYEKIVARTQKRRPRHMKGVTPSTPDLINQLESEREDQAKLDSGEYDEEDEEEYEDDENDEEYEDDEELPLPADEAAVLPPEVAKTSYVGDKYEPEGETRLGDEVEETRARAQKSGRRVGDDLENIGEEGQESAQAVADTAGDAADASGKRLRKTGKRVGDNLEEIRKAGETAFGESGDVVRKQADRAADNFQEGVEEAGNTAKDLAGIAQATAEDAGKQLRGTGEEIMENLEDIGQEGQKVLGRGGGGVGNQARRGVNQLGKQAKEAQRNTGRAIDKTLAGAQRSAERVQDPIAKAVNASLSAAAAIGDEVFKFGDTLIEAAELATGMAGADGADDDDDDKEEELVGGRYKPAGKKVMRKYQGANKEGEQGDEEEGGPYSDVKVLVAGASGRTGRLIVKNLVQKGASVRALVRSVYRARNLKQLQGAELVEGDLYKYETVKEALADCNMVICAIGARGLPFDLMQTYRTEYEGVLNLISAAKNQGDIKKFVFITTIGVNTFQVIPLLYWKRQAELFLQRSGLDYTIVRPAGLTSGRGESGTVELRPADSLFMGAVSRSKVAEVCVSALITDAASEKVVEVVGTSGRVRRSIEDQFENV